MHVTASGERWGVGWEIKCADQFETCPPGHSLGIWLCIFSAKGGIWTLNGLNGVNGLISCCGVIRTWVFFGFYKVWRIYKIVNNSFKRVFIRSLRVSSRHISLWKVWTVFDSRRNLSLRRGISILIGGAIEQLFCPAGGEGIWTIQPSKVQMPGGLPGGDVEVSNWSAHNVFV